MLVLSLSLFSLPFSLSSPSLPPSFHNNRLPPRLLVLLSLTPRLSPLPHQKLLGNSLLKLEGDDRLDINCTLPLTDQVRTPYAVI